MFYAFSLYNEYVLVHELPSGRIHENLLCTMHQRWIFYQRKMLYLLEKSIVPFTQPCVLFVHFAVHYSYAFSSEILIWLLIPIIYDD